MMLGRITIFSSAVSTRIAVITITLGLFALGACTQEAPPASQNFTAPYISGIVAVPPVVQPGESTQVSVVVVANADASLSYEWLLPGGWTRQGEGDSVTLVAPDAYGRNDILTVVVDDGNLEVRAQVFIGTFANQAPIIQSFTTAPTALIPGGQAQLEVQLFDANGETPQITWALSDNAWTLTPDAADARLATLVAPVDPTAATQPWVRVSVQVSDAADATVESALVIPLTVYGAPVIQTLSAGANPLFRNASTPVSVSVASDNPPLTYAWTVDDSTWEVQGDGTNVVVFAPDSAGAQTLLQVTVTDALGQQSAAALTLSTHQNRAPWIAALQGVPNPVPPEQVSTLTVSAGDPDGDALTYAWSVDESDWVISGTGASVSLQAPAQLDRDALVRVQVSDGDGLMATAQLRVSTTVCGAGPHVVSRDGRCEPCGTGALLDDFPRYFLRFEGDDAADALREEQGRFLAVTGEAQDFGAKGMVQGQNALFLEGHTKSWVAAENLDDWPGTAITVEFWARSASPRSAGWVSYATATQTNAFLVYGGDSLSVFINGAARDTGVAINDGLWHHLAITWQSADGALALYKDGELAYSGMHMPGAVMESGGTLVLGQDQDAVFGGFQASQAAQGRMDEFAVFDRVLADYRIDLHRRTLTCGETCNGIDDGGPVGIDEGLEGMCPEQAPATCEDLRTAAVGESDFYWIDLATAPGGEPVLMYCDFASDGGVGHSWLRLEDDSLVAGDQTPYRDLCASYGLEVIVPRTRSHARRIVLGNGEPPNLVNVFPKSDGVTGGLLDWQGRCAGVDGCSFYLSDSNNANCGGFEPSGDNNTSDALYRSAGGCDFGVWNDANNALALDGWVLCSDNATTLPTATSCEDLAATESFSNVGLDGISGLYGLDIGGTTTPAFCEHKTAGGGWNLLAVIDGDSTTFGNNSPTWASTATMGTSPTHMGASEISNIDYVDIAYGALATDEVRLCFLDTDHCYTFLHRQGIALAEFFASGGPSFDAVSVNIAGHADVGTLAEVDDFFYAIGFSGGTSTMGCYWLGINQSFNTSAIGLMGDLSGGCGAEGAAEAQIDDLALGVGLQSCDDNNGCAPGGSGHLAGHQANIAGAFDGMGPWLLFGRQRPVLASCEAFAAAGYTLDGEYPIDADGAGAGRAVSQSCDLGE